MSASLNIFVFSFNRGIFLENCLTSIERCAGELQTIIIDDGSTDPETIKALSKLSEKYEVIYPKEGQGERKTGGLYGNMNHAMALSRQRGFKRVLFLQDDMQLVRKLKQQDFDLIDRFFLVNKNCIQLQTCFRRSETKENLKATCYVDASKTALLIYDDMESGKDNFSATGIFDVARSGALLGSFVVGEGANSTLCRAKSIKKALSLYPFMNWLPYPTSYRGKARSFSHRIIERLGGSGFHPIEHMNEKDACRFIDRDSALIPFAEDWLICKTSPRSDRWSTAGGEYNLVARGGFWGNAFTFLRKTKRRLRDIF